jgi:hypothetical protein
MKGFLEPVLTNVRNIFKKLIFLSESASQIALNIVSFRMCTVRDVAVQSMFHFLPYTL